MKRIIITAILTFTFTALAVHAVTQTAFSGAGVIESTTGGFKFPDGSVQLSAAIQPLTQTNFIELNCIGCPIPIPATTGTYFVESNLTVENCAEIVEVSLDLDIPHPYSADVEVDLSNGEFNVVAIKGKLTADGCPTPDVLVTIDDQASLTINQCNNLSPGIVGILRPYQSFKNFIGRSGNGEWTLKVADVWPPHGDGTLNDWTLEVLCHN